jgi:hypothetical protein
MIFEFELSRAEGRENGVQAVNMQLLSPRRRSGVGAPSSAYSSPPPSTMSAGSSLTAGIPPATPPLPQTGPLAPAASAPEGSPPPAPDVKPSEH